MKLLHLKNILVWLLAIILILPFFPHPAAAASSFCAPLPAPSGSIMNVSTATQLSNAVSSAASGTTILLADGTYTISSTLYIRTPNITIRSASGNRDAVIIDGNYQPGEDIYVDASNFTLADVTVKRAKWHPIHVVSGGTNVMLYNISVIDGGQQFIKVNASSTGYGDNGTVACSYLELTPTGRSYVEANPASADLGCYTGGVDALQVRDWTVRDSTFKGFYCTNGYLSQHAVHFWVTDRDPIIERNTFINNARAIGLGLGTGQGSASTANVRIYSDLANLSNLASIDSFGGVIRNNFVYSNIAQFDTGIGFESAWNSAVYHNTIFVSGGLPLDFRFSGTNTIAKNNLISGSISIRDGATPTQQTNVTGAGSGLFVNVANADLHLLSTASSAINKGTSLAGLVASDIDGQTRDSQPDVGADEYSTAIPTPTPTPTPIVGDINLDHIVNSLDWSAMNAKWFTSTANCDLNNDGLVNSLDFSILNTNWFKTW